MPPRVRLGQTYATPGVLDGITRRDLLRGLLRHLSGDWGDVDADDWEANECALVTGGRLWSSYRSSDGQKYWIITEADRSSTTVLFPDEY